LKTGRTLIEGVLEQVSEASILIKKEEGSDREVEKTAS
jgi:hypothetical protein